MMYTNLPLVVCIEDIFSRFVGFLFFCKKILSLFYYGVKETWNYSIYFAGRILQLKKGFFFLMKVGLKNLKWRC